MKDDLCSPFCQDPEAFSLLRAIIKYITYKGIMDTSPEMQFYYLFHAVFRKFIVGAWPSPDMAAAS